MVEALGGVDICIPEPLQDESAGLDVQAGEQRLDPEQALAFVRRARATRAVISVAWIASSNCSAR